MQAFHNDINIKNKYIERMKAHILADELIRGNGWDKETNSGCAVGCTLDNYSHKNYEIELGLPEWSARVEDKLYEGVNTDINLQMFMSEDIKTWILANNLDINSFRMFPLVFLDIIKVGSDVNKIKSDFMIYILESNLSNFDNEEFSSVTKAIKQIIHLYRTNEIDEGKWGSAKSAARSAKSAACAAARSAAASAAWADAAWADAAESAACAAAKSAAACAACASAACASAACASAAWADAAESAACAAAAWAAAAESASAESAGAARTAAYDRYAAKLLDLIKECK